MRPIDLSKLKLVYEIARQENMTRAADKLNLTQSALSKALINLEDQLGTKLFDRISTGMRLTPQGERLYIHARNILEQHNNFEKEFYDKEEEVSGDLRIVTTSYLGAEWLAPCLEGFTKRHPKVHFQILIRSENIHPTEADIAICTFIQHQPHLIQKPLFTAYTRLFASPSYLRKYGEPKSLEELNHHRLITYKGNHYSSYGSTNWILNVGNNPGALPRKSYFDIESLHGMLNCALLGYGIVEFPDYSKVFKLGLKEVLPDLIGPEIKIYYAFPETRKNSKKIKLLYEYLSKQQK
ncbi:MAG: LysR family transcriptional regulator [Candidatus Paracaedibacteraceae bacterium]|nr:LysR family transcriptional regulator [Candidatus Paracaedibacteraceae bacterium]